MPIDARPTLEAPDDDPYLWLEEIEGERALAFVEQQNKLTLGKFARRELRSRSRHAGFDLRSAGQHSLYQPPRRLRLQPLEGREQSARPLATHDDRGIPKRRADVGRHSRRRRIGESGKRRLDPVLGQHAARQSPRTRCSACRAAAATRRCCANSISSRRPSSKAASICRRPRAARTWLDADTLLLSSAYGGEAMVDHLRLRPNDQAVAARHQRRSGACAVRGAGDSMVAYVSVDRTVADAENLASSNRPASSIWRSGSAMRRARRRSSTCRATSGSKRIRTGWWSSAARPGPSAATTYPPDTMLGISLSAFLAGDRNFTVVFEPGPRRALQGFFWSAGKLVLSILDELRACVRGADAVERSLVADQLARPAGDRRRRCLAPRHRRGREQR